MSDTINSISFELVGRNESGIPILQWDAQTQTTVNVVMFGRGRLVISRTGTIQHGYDDGWCYDSLEGALIALADWNPLEAPEPDGWRKNVNSGTYRLDGDARYIYRNFEEEMAARAQRELDREALCLIS